MILLRQWGIILAILLSCNAFVKLCSFPLPGNIVGLLVLLILLESKIIKPEQIEHPTKFLLDHLAFFFIPSAVKIIICYPVIANSWWKISFICILSTILVIVVSGKLTEWVNHLFNSEKKDSVNDSI